MQSADDSSDGVSGSPKSQYLEKQVIYSSSSSSINSDVKEKIQDSKNPPGSDNTDNLDYTGRSEDEIKILKDQITVEVTSVSYFTLYRYATRFDICLILLSNLFAIISGALLPMFTVVMGGLTNNFRDYFTSAESGESFQHAVNHNTLFFLYLLIAMTFFSSVQTFIAVDRGEVLAARIRHHYIRAILRQNIGYFDNTGPGEITNRITTDVNQIQDGISEKLNIIFTGFATFFAGLIIAFIRYWKLTLMLLSTTASILMLMAGSSVFIVKYSSISSTSFGKASSIAEDILSSIRNTTAFGAQRRLSKQYENYINQSFSAGVKSGRALTVMIAGFWCILFLSYALAFWQGARFIADGSTSPGALITVFMCVVIGAMSLGNVAPAIQAVSQSVGAAKKIFEAIDRVPCLDSASEEGTKLDNVQGDIEFKNVKFAYPSRPNVTVLEDFNLKVKPGMTVALVGASGSGKSTCIGIIERFYEYLDGEVTIDGHDIRSLNIRWLRQQMALVSQEPALFSVSIYENISYGLIGTPYEHAPDEQKMELVVKACKEANAWDFIQNLTEGLDTNVGQAGFLLSGGQKQRIAIARAIVSQPKILLLDEATSALDTKSEGVVQEALDRASANRTTIVIAHRLSTIKDADLIVVMSRGEIIEQGTHRELLAKQGGAYSMLVHAQNIRGEEERQNASGVVQIDKYSEDNSSEDDEKIGAYVSTASEPVVTRKQTRNSVVSDQPLSGKDIGDLEENGMLETAPSHRSSIQLIRYLHTFTVGYNKIVILSLFSAVCCGVGYPIMAYIYGHALSALMVPPSEYAYMKSRADFYSGFFVLLGGLEFFCFCGLIGGVTYHSQVLVRAIRVNVFQHYLRMDISYFDSEAHSTGALTSILSKDSQAVEGFSGIALGQALQSLSTLLGGIIMAIVIDWRLGLVCTACVPILVGCGFFRIWVITKLEEKSKKTYSNSGQFACESVSSVRTVASLTKEQLVCEVYSNAVQAQVVKSRISLSRSAILYGLSQGLTPGIMGLGFWYGSTLVRMHTISFYQFYASFVAVVFGAQSAGQVFSYSPSMGKARQASQNVARIFDTQPTIDPTSTEGGVLDDVVGDVEFRDVHFKYPTRLHVPVLNGLNLTVKRGQYVALVGASGCGKSTTIGLIEQFYRPLAGQILIDGIDISTLNVAEYRKHIGLVQQEPVLYRGSIRDNILLGLDDQQIETVIDDQVYAAAKKANIHDFIMSLPEGYETDTGSKGALLSGGQKQRIAIARALIRNPKVLLLDEATSALDSESEKVVQAALDEAAKGRTTIAVAHRLSTIQNADIIYIFDKGRVAEAGTHEELLKLKGLYYQLVKMQDLESQL